MCADYKGSMMVKKVTGQPQSDAGNHVEKDIKSSPVVLQLPLNVM